MEKLIEAWRKKALWEDKRAKECFEENCQIYSQGHSSAAEIYRHCADELQRHLTSRSSRAAEACVYCGQPIGFKTKICASGGACTAACLT